MLQSSTDLQTATLLELSAVVIASHVNLTQLESFQEVADTFNIQKVSSLAAPTGSFAVKLAPTNAEMTSGVTADDLYLFKNSNF